MVQQFHCLAKVIEAVLGRGHVYFVLHVRAPEKPLVCQQASVLQTKGYVRCQQTLSFLLFYFLHNCV